MPVPHFWGVVAGRGTYFPYRGSQMSQLVFVVGANRQWPSAEAAWPALLPDFADFSVPQEGLAGLFPFSALRRQALPRPVVFERLQKSRCLRQAVAEILKEGAPAAAGGPRAQPYECAHQEQAWRPGCRQCLLFGPLDCLCPQRCRCCEAEFLKTAGRYQRAEMPVRLLQPRVWESR